MAKFLGKASLALLLTGGLLVMIFFALPSQYQSFYTSAMLTKYERLMSSESPKLILVSGSSMAFGVNSEILEQAFAMPVINLGMHAGLGPEYSLSVAKQNVKEGDMIIYAPEYWHDSGMQTELALIASQDKMELLITIPKSNWKDTLYTVPSYLRKKLIRFSLRLDDLSQIPDNEYSPVYFNEYGDNVYDRPYNNIPVEAVQEEIYSLSEEHITISLIEHTNMFSDWARKRGARLLITYPPMNSASIVYSDKEIASFEKTLKGLLKAPLISKAEDYIYPHGLFYGTNFHLNNQGVTVRTQQLIKDIQAYMS